MPYDLHKGHAALRRGRVSICGAEYFLTICTDGRCLSLTLPAIAESILAETGAMDADATWRLRCAVVMPDHLHLLVVLGNRLTLGKAVARLKSKTANLLGSSGLKWERDFHDHHIRPDEERLALFLYLYLNPYRADLCKRSEPWPWYRCSPDDWRWFKDCLQEDRPAPEWLKD
jgi:REP element-mobilizing transposase RayT